MKFDIFFSNETPLCYAVRMGNIDVIKLLLENDKIDVNIPHISITRIFI